MSLDLSRIRFDPRDDFLGVLMQQGRVQLDSDWNEWVAQIIRRVQAGTLDTFNGPAVPRMTPDGFRIEAAGGNLRIHPGRMYVDGMLVHCHGGDPDDWDAHLAETEGTAPIDYADQPYYPNPPSLPAAGPHLVYLDVWQREITALEAPELIEQAIGVDTTGRLRSIWQVKLLPDVGNTHCATANEDIPGWDAIRAPAAARLTTSTGTPTVDPDPCIVPPAAGYRGLENQFYRVEVHAGGPPGTATFKWSRDNATVTSRVIGINGNRDALTVETIGRDDNLSFHGGDWVEVTDDWRVLHGLPGELRRIRPAGGVDPSAKTLTLETALPAGLFPTDGNQATNTERNTLVRRWDQSGTVIAGDQSPWVDLDAFGSDGAIPIPAGGTTLFLEHGILVRFDLEPSGGAFRPGDYWTFAARSVEASIEQLNRAPPRGVHHHYARLAIVDFPQTETDCRTLWPALAAEGQGCDCTVCVSADGHNSGTATLQQAIDSIKDTGGTLCLGIGSYLIAAPLNLDGARSLRIRGQGWGTSLVRGEPGGTIEIRDSVNVALENLTLIGSASAAAGSVLIAASNVVDLSVEGVNLLALASNRGTSIGIGLSGFALGVTITDCGIVAERGLVAAPLDKREYLVSAELRVRRNLFFCSQLAIELDGLCLHGGTTAVDDNLMLVGDRAALIATGAALPGATLRINDNVITTGGHGMLVGVGHATIRGNEIGGASDRAGHGIVLLPGLDPTGVDEVRISDNRLHDLGGDAIQIKQRVETITIYDNLIDDIGLGALVMVERGAAHLLRLSGNRCRRLGVAVTGDNAAYAAIQIIRCARVDLLNNHLIDVGRNAMAASAVEALRGIAVGQMRLAGNRFVGIGPNLSGGRIVVVRLLLPLDSADISDNRIDRRPSSDGPPSTALWRAIEIGPLSKQADVAEPVFSSVVMATAGGPGYVITKDFVAEIAEQRARVSLRGNRLEGIGLDSELLLCTALSDCVVSDNHCESTGIGRTEPRIGRIEAEAIRIANNRFIAYQDRQTLLLQPKRKQAIVIGNHSSGRIDIDSGVPVPADITLTNIFGL